MMERGEVAEMLERSMPPRMPPVRITYRLKGQRAVNTRTLSHNAYREWVENMAANEYVLLEAGQVLEDA